MISGKKILCAAPPIYGHTVPLLALALKLRANGNEANVISYGDHMNQLLERYGATVIRKEPKSLLEMAVETKSLLEKYQPDITVCDFSIDLWLATRVWRPECRVSILRCELFLGYERRNLLLPDKFEFESKYQIDLVNDYFQRSGTAPVADLRELCTAEVVVVPSVPQIDSLPNRVLESYPDASFVYTGPLLLPFGEAISEPLKEWLALRRLEGMPIVLITLGTLWGAKIYRILAECLESTNLAVVIVVPYEKERHWLHEREGPRLRVIGFTDLLDLARYSDVVIHHCGHGTLHSVLLAGKPSITLASGEYDREDNAVRLEELDCGRHLGHNLFRKGFSGDIFASAVHEVLADNAIQNGVREMSKIVRHYVENLGPTEFVRTLAQRMHMDPSYPGNLHTVPYSTKEL